MVPCDRERRKEQPRLSRHNDSWERTHWSRRGLRSIQSTAAIASIGSRKNEHNIIFDYFPNGLKEMFNMNCGQVVDSRI